jgi:hypothetical protein
MTADKPYIIQFDSIGDTALGYISVAEENKNIPFTIKRTYWTYYTPQSVNRGGYANIDKELVLIAVAGTIKVDTELQNGHTQQFVLDRPHIGLFMPKLCWHTMKYTHNSVQLVLASNFYSASDYIRDYSQFQTYGK